MTAVKADRSGARLGGPLRAVRYHRISRDPEGLAVGVERQNEDTAALCEAQGFDVVGTFTDNDVSASTLSKKPRPGFDDALAMCRRGEADVIVAYSNSRLTRRPLELEALIDLHNRYGVRILTQVSGEDDLSTADGRMVARIKANVDAAESERSGERIKRAALQRAQQGKAHGGGKRPFGYADNRIDLHPAEAPMVREAAAALLAGRSVGAILREWNTAGVRTPFGNDWKHTPFRALMTSPRIAGLRRYRGAIMRDADGNDVMGPWEPILDRETWDRVQDLLDTRRKTSARPGRRRYLLSGLLRCSECGGRLSGDARGKLSGGHGYAHRILNGSPEQNHGVSVLGRWVESMVCTMVEARLRERALTDPGEGDAFPGDARLAEIPRLVADLMDAYRAGTLSGGIVFPQVQELEGEQAALSAERRRYVAAHAGPVDADPAAFADLPQDRKRAVIESLISAIVVRPTGQGRIDPDRIEIVWRSCDSRV